MTKVVDELLDRWDHLREALRYREVRRAIVYSCLLGVVLTLGVFGSIAATRGPSGSTVAAGSRYELRTVRGDVITRTIDGKVQRVIRYRTKRGDVVYETVPRQGTTVAGAAVTLPGKTVRQTHTQVATQTIASTVTQTATEIVTVTQIEPVTVTIVETETRPGPP